MLTKQIDKYISALLMAACMVVFTALIAGSVNAVTDTTRPTILYISPLNSVSPANNERNVSTYEQVTVMFSEDMDPSSINKNTFTVMQRTTPESKEYRSLAIDGAILYSSRTATFTSRDRFGPNQIYGNVFTVTVTTGAKDLSGNSLKQNYVWSFTTGGDAFNTGSTTSQQAQNAAPISGSVVATPSVAPVKSVQTTVTNNFPWEWVIGGLALLLLLGLIFIPARKPATQQTIQEIHASPFGEVHSVKEIEGIGQEYSERLNAMGIMNTHELWEANAIKVSEGTEAPVSVVKSWQHMAELASVNDIGPQYAELLERSGVHSIAQLKSCNPKELLRLVRKKQDSLKVNIQGNFPGYVSVKNWINQARDHKFTYTGGQAA